MQQRIALPYMGDEYTAHLEKCLKEAGANIEMPPKISKNTIKFGVKNSPDFICYPFKITLGSYIEALDNGANILLQFDSCGQCRLKHYYKVQELILKRMGYNFEMYNVNIKNFIKVCKKISGCSTFKAITTAKNIVKGIKEIDKKYKFDENKINIGIIGEIYSCCEPRINYDIENKIKKLDANPYNTANLTSFIYDSMGFNYFKDKKYKKQAKMYFNGSLGGHGIENIYNLLWMIDKKLIDGVVHLMPLSCCPEAMIEPIVNAICQDNKMPLQRFMIDETSNEANVDMRIETLVEQIKEIKK
ncbi:MAG: hypothetical protein IIB81_03675 [Nanoarchaeota archaeon]|nr:hypothetical protein [Nanoarchaeota archaeon]